MTYDYATARAETAKLYPNPIFTLDDDGVVDVRNFFYTGCPCGSLVETPDGRRWTVCYHNLDGFGVVDGERSLAGVVDDDLPQHTHLLRIPHPVHTLPCLGEIVRVIWKAPK